MRAPVCVCPLFLLYILHLLHPVLLLPPFLLPPFFILSLHFYNHRRTEAPSDGNYHLSVYKRVRAQKERGKLKKKKTPHVFVCVWFARGLVHTCLYA